MRDSWTLTHAARVLDEPQHRLIYLCEQGVVRPEHGDARGRGSSRRFSARNLLHFAVALHLRQLQIPVSVLAAVVYALTAFEKIVRTEEPEFELPMSLLGLSASDLRIVIGDGRFLYLFFDWRGTPRVFGRVDLQPLRTDRLALEALRQRSQFMKPLPASDVFSQAGADVGGPEGSRYWRLEVGVTRVARDLRLDR